jgi:hypothetical protein
MTHRAKRGCALTDVWCLILPATRAAINVENYSATRYGHVTIAECPAHYFGCRTYHFGSAVERFRQQIAEQAIENEGRRSRGANNAPE